jgi:hypothetical protein
VLGHALGRAPLLSNTICHLGLRFTSHHGSPFEKSLDRVNRRSGAHPRCTVDGILASCPPIHIVIRDCA